MWARKISCTETRQLIVKQRGVDIEGGGDNSRQASSKGLWSESMTRARSGQDYAAQTPVRRIKKDSHNRDYSPA